MKKGKEDGDDVRLRSAEKEEKRGTKRKRGRSMRFNSVQRERDF